MLLDWNTYEMYLRPGRTVCCAVEYVLGRLLGEGRYYFRE